MVHYSNDKNMILATSFTERRSGEFRIIFLDVPFYIDPNSEQYKSYPTKEANEAIRWYIDDFGDYINCDTFVDFDDIFDHYCSEFGIEIDYEIEEPEEKEYLN